MTKTANVEIEAGLSVRCFCPPNVAIHQNASCIASINGVLEFGRVVTIEESGEAEGRNADRVKVVRQATLQDQAKAGDNTLRGKMAMDSCVQKAAKLGLGLRIVRTRYNFDRTILNVLFAAAEHVDTHEMIKELASELGARIEMKQIGVRDEAGHIGGMGPCGRQMCCCSWLKDFEAINVKMAKVQRLSLNPGAISGNCGRLKCCLRYEYNLYREMGKHLPRQGAQVECQGCEGCVISRNILAQKVTVSLSDARIVECDASEVKEVWKKQPHTGRSEDDEDSGSEWSEP